MSFPRFSAEQSLGRSSLSSRSTYRPRETSSVVPQGCSMTKKIACGSAFVVCGASCALGPEICLPCLGAVGATDCLSCLLDW
jgi:hypothetical protein